MAATALPVNYDLRLYRGDDYFVGLVYDEVDSETGDSLILDVTGWTALLQIRTAPGGEVWLALTDTDDLSLGAGSAGGVEVSVWIRSSTTSQDAWAARTQGTWDIQLTSPDGIVTTPFAGRFFMTQDVSRASVEVPS